MKQRRDVLTSIFLVKAGNKVRDRGRQEPVLVPKQTQVNKNMKLQKKEREGKRRKKKKKKKKAQEQEQKQLYAVL